MNVHLSPLAIALLLIPIQQVSAKMSVSTGFEYLDFSSDKGKRNETFAEFSGKFDKATIVTNITRGERDYGHNEKFVATRGMATLYYDWHKRLSTRTKLTVSSNSPVFVRQQYEHDFDVKIIPNAILILGGSHAKYYDDVNVNTWSTGTSIYVQKFIFNYRYSNYHTSKRYNSHSHIFSLRMNDPQGEGNTQLWLARGTGAYTYDYLGPGIHKGRSKSVSLRRVQPLTESLKLAAVIGKQWYKTPIEKYHSLQGELSIIYSW